MLYVTYYNAVTVTYKKNDDYDKVMFLDLNKFKLHFYLHFSQSYACFISTNHTFEMTKLNENGSGSLDQEFGFYKKQLNIEKYLLVA